MNSEHSREVEAQILDTFAREGTRVDQLAEGDPLREKSWALQEAFTQGVALLKVFPNSNIKELGTLVWDLVGSHIVPVALGPDVQSLTFSVVAKDEVQEALIFVPHNWMAVIEEDLVCQIGALVYIGSQARDYYNKRIDKDTMPRARAFEAEFLLAFKKLLPTYTFNEWQLKSVKDYPQGLQSESIRHALYTSKPFVPPS